MQNFNNFIVQVATLGRLGHCKILPGTIGAFLGTIFSCLIFMLFKQRVVIVLSFILMLFAIYICHFAEKSIGSKDPSCIIFDEFVAMPVCFVFILERYNSIWLFLIGFIVFRIFDIIKPFNLKKLEKFNGGFGIVLDDIGAAIYTNITLQILSFLLKFFGRF